MTDNHPIIPPDELIRQLRCMEGTWLDKITKVYRAGADMELEACVEWLDKGLMTPYVAIRLREDRRSKPPTLNSIALQMLGTIERDAHYIPEITDTIRKALEALPND